MQDHYLLWKTEIKKYNISCFRNIIFPIRTKHARIFLIKFNPSTIRSAFAIFICRVFGHLTNLMKGHVHLIFTCPKQTTSCQIFKVKLKSIILSLTEGQSGWITGVYQLWMRLSKVIMLQWRHNWVFSINSYTMGSL